MPPHSRKEWSPAELLHFFTLTEEELALVGNKSGPTRLGFAALLKFFQYAGRFPLFKNEIPPVVLQHLTPQVEVEWEEYLRYDWRGRSVKYHRQQIRQFVGFGEATHKDLQSAQDWLSDLFEPNRTSVTVANLSVILEEESLVAAFYHYFRLHKLEPLSSDQLIRAAHTVLRWHEATLFTRLAAKIPELCRQELDQLLELQPFVLPATAELAIEESEVTSTLPHSHSSELELESVLIEPDQATSEQAQEQAQEQEQSVTRSFWHQLRLDPEGYTLQSVLKETAKLTRLKKLALPPDLFSECTTAQLHAFRARIGAETIYEIKRHPDQLRYVLMAAFCHLRQSEITDNLVELTSQITHRIRTKATNKADQLLLKDLRKVSGKTGLLFRLAEAAVEQPDLPVKTVIYPVVSEQTLKDLVREHRAEGHFYQRQLHTTIRASYGQHYRRMLPGLLDTLVFRSNNLDHQPIIEALALLKKYAHTKQRYYPFHEKVPLDGVVASAWRELVEEKVEVEVEEATGTGGKGAPLPKRINCINYELAVLESLRDKLRSKEIWVEGARRYQNPDRDLPADFEENKTSYYQLLGQPLEVKAFIQTVQTKMQPALAALETGLVTKTNLDVEIEAKGHIKLSPFEAEADGPAWVKLREEVQRRWAATSLLDVLKEVALRTGFLDHFKSLTGASQLERPVLQRRLLLALYALGTNTGLKSLSTSGGGEGESYQELLHIKQRFISKEALRGAIESVVNRLLEERSPQVWGSGTSSCASDSTFVAAWDQNLLTERHVRYGGRGVVIYWHVEKHAACIYSQLKTPSSSEVAAMLEGLLHHNTTLALGPNYVDTHGQSEVGFAFCHLLGFELRPRFKNIYAQKLYVPSPEQADHYPTLKPVLARPIRWELIEQQYNEMVKLATALKQGTANAEAILRRFTRHNATHPTYKALAELGKAVKTIFLAEYLHSVQLRREIGAGLNTVERWNGVNDFILFGKGGELATHSMAQQELTTLSLHLLQLSLVYVNTLILQNLLLASPWREERQDEAQLAGLTPLLHAHINPYGRFELDLNVRLPLDKAYQEMSG